MTALKTLAGRIDKLPIDQQIELLYTLAKIDGDLGRDAEAFDQLIAGNAKKRRTMDYNEMQELGFYSAVEQTFTSELLREKSGQGKPDACTDFYRRHAALGNDVDRTDPR